MSYVFDPEVLHTIVRRVVGGPREQVFDRLVAELDHAYPGRVYIGERQWIFNNAGGAMGQMTFLHASLTEYLTIFGTPIGTEGHSGRYSTEVWDYLLDGEMWGYEEGATDREVLLPGEVHHLVGKVAKGYRIPDHAWMLEYSRGSILSMFPFGLADTLTSTLDLSVLARTVTGYGARVVDDLRVRSRPAISRPVPKAPPAPVEIRAEA